MLIVLGVWHQMLRRMLEMWALATTNLLGLDPRSALGGVVVTAVAFFFSGIGHGMNVWAVDHRLGWGQFVFFTLQAVGIWIETAVSWIYMHMTADGEKGTSRELSEKERLAVKTIGYLWVIGWTTYTGPFGMDELILIELFKAEPTPISPFRWALGIKS